MSAPPPVEIRATWKALTMVEPKAKVSGSTSLLCWLLALVKVSTLIWRRVSWAEAAGASNASNSKANRRQQVFRSGDHNLSPFIRDFLPRVLELCSTHGT